METLQIGIIKGDIDKSNEYRALFNIPPETGQYINNRGRKIFETTAKAMLYEFSLNIYEISTKEVDGKIGSIELTSGIEWDIKSIEAAEALIAGIIKIFPRIAGYTT